jgi:hypothetical protein
MISITDGKISRDDSAWLAGFFDGEGCVQLTGSSGTLYVNITQKWKGILRFITSMFGFCHISNMLWDDKRAFNLQMHGEKAAKLLYAIRPFVKNKKNQVETALEFYELYGRDNYSGRTDSQAKKDAALYYSNLLKKQKRSECEWWKLNAPSVRKIW